MFGGVQMTAAAVGGWAERRRGPKSHLKLPADPRSELPAANPLLQEETRVISILFSFLHISALLSAGIWTRGGNYSGLIGAKNNWTGESFKSGGGSPR